MAQGDAFQTTRNGDEAKACFKAAGRDERL
jgi:hypothetical protein